MSLACQQVEQALSLELQIPPKEPFKITVFINLITFFFADHRFLIQGMLGFFAYFLLILMCLLVNIIYFHSLILIIEFKTFILSKNSYPQNQEVNALFLFFHQ